MDTISFGQVMQSLRPQLHRYCARMLGSAFDGEDVVQEALAKAVEALPQSGTIERPDSWLFRIAHNAALDALRRKRHRASFETDLATAEDAVSSSDTDARIAAESSLATLFDLPVAQRAVVVLADVLGHPLAETASILDLTLPAVKAALHRARLRLRTLAAAPAAVSDVAIDADERARLREYADRFNARDFDALRALLAEDVRLDLVNRTRMAGRDVAVYFTRYSERSVWHVRPGLAEGRPALLFSDLASDRGDDGTVRYVVLLGWRDGRIATIRDFHYAPYVTESLVTAPL